MIRNIFYLLLLSSVIFAASPSDSIKFFNKVKSFQMSDDRGQLYVGVTNQVHIVDYPVAVDLRTNCKKEEEEWKVVMNVDFLRYCDIDIGKTKMNSSRTTLSLYVQKTDLDDLNSPTRSDNAGPKCLRPEWVHIDLSDYCKKD